MGTQREMETAKINNQAERDVRHVDNAAVSPSLLAGLSWRVGVGVPGRLNEIKARDDAGEQRVVVDDQSLCVEAAITWATRAVNRIHLFCSPRFYCKLYTMDEEYDVSFASARRRVGLTYPYRLSFLCVRSLSLSSRRILEQYN